jgi:RimJ/RimL family protein N-acetyltransferase
MSAKLHLRRLITYFRGQGFLNTFKRLGIIFWRSVFLDKTVLSYVDLAVWKGINFRVDYNVEFQCKKSCADFFEKDLQKLANHEGTYRGNNWVIEKMEDRFRRGALLWLLNLNGEFAGYGWSIRGNMGVPFFLPLTINDAVLIDGEVFPEFRGRGVNPLLLEHMLGELKKMGVTRVFSTIKVWNKASLRATSKTQFQRFAIARKLHLFGKNITIWYEM